MPFYPRGVGTNRHASPATWSRTATRRRKRRGRRWSQSGSPCCCFGGRRKPSPRFTAAGQRRASRIGWSTGCDADVGLILESYERSNVSSTTNDTFGRLALNVVRKDLAVGPGCCNVGERRCPHNHLLNPRRSRNTLRAGIAVRAVGPPVPTPDCRPANAGDMPPRSRPPSRRCPEPLALRPARAAPSNRKALRPPPRAPAAPCSFDRSEALKSPIRSELFFTFADDTEFFFRCLAPTLALGSWTAAYPVPPSATNSAIIEMTRAGDGRVKRFLIRGTTSLAIDQDFLTSTRKGANASPSAPPRRPRARRLCAPQSASLHHGPC